MIYEGEISGVVIKGKKRHLLLDVDKPVNCSEVYDGRCIRMLEIGDKEYKKLSDEYAKRAIHLKKVALERKPAVTRKIKTLGPWFDFHAEKNLFDFIANREFLRKFKKFYMEREGSPCLNHVAEQEVRRIEGIASKDPDKVEETIDMLGRLRAELSDTREWHEIMRENNIKIALIFPYYNEPTIISNIRDIWDLIEEDLVKEVILADGWSTNPSAEVVQHRLDAPLTFVKNPGTGKGEALEGAIKYAAYQGMDLVICLDSDILPPLHTIKGIPPLPIDITCNFFARSFIDKFVKILREHGKEKALKTFYKASYMRVPKSGIRLTPLRFGGTTRFVRHLYKFVGFRTMTECVYPLSGEYAFNPGFLLERLSISREFHDLYRERYHGATLPSGFTIENFWNTLMEVKGIPVAFCNTFIHHHIPRGKKVKDELVYAKQRANVFRGGFGAMLQSMPKEGLEKYIKKFDFELFRFPRPELRIKLEDKKVKSMKFI
jgi:hypothetical protein